jgi:hypothetical protein
MTRTARLWATASARTPVGSSSPGGSACDLGVTAGCPKKMVEAGGEPLHVGAGRTVLPLAGHVVRPTWGGRTLRAGTPASPRDTLVADLGPRVEGEQQPVLGARHAVGGEVLVAEGAVHLRSSSHVAHRADHAWATSRPSSSVRVRPGACEHRQLARGARDPHSGR